MPLRARGLADRPGEPYPAALRVEWTRRESNPHPRHARPASSRWTTGPDSGDDGNRTQPVRVRGGLATLAHAPPFELRRPDLNRRRTAHETVLGPGSSPLRSQYSRQDSNLRSPGCEPGAVASGPRECRVVPAGFEPATSTMSGWRALQAAPRDCRKAPETRFLGENGFLLASRAGRSRTCLKPRIRRSPRRPVPGPIERPVRDSNPSRLFDKQVATPAASQGGQECPAGVAPACPPRQGGASAARPRTRRARTEGVEPSASGLEPDCSPGSTSFTSGRGRIRTCKGWSPRPPSKRVPSAGWLALPDRRRLKAAGYS
jgi:hypothetical protein